MEMVRGNIRLHSILCYIIVSNRLLLQYITVHVDRQNHSRVTMIAVVVSVDSLNRASGFLLHNSKGKSHLDHFQYKELNSFVLVFWRRFLLSIHPYIYIYII